MDPATTHDLASVPPGAGEEVSGRERLLQSVIDLCEASGGARSQQAQAVVETLFLDLIGQAEREVRLRLAQRLATAPWAPSGLINTLALDDIEIARPIIAKSPVLKDQDLILLLTLATLEHQIEVAKRPGLGAKVVDAILDQGHAAVLTALANNLTAVLSQRSMTQFVGLSRRIVEIREPLSRHPELTLELASVLYTWVGSTLREALESRFQIDAQSMEAAVRQAVVDSVAGVPAAPAAENPEGDPNEMEARLVAKLQAAGQLRPGFLLRALRQGKLHLFLVALASLANVKTEAVRAAVDSDQPHLLALCCAAVGVDRSVFPTILSFVRALNHSSPCDGPAGPGAVSDAFCLKGEGAALAAFQSGVAALHA